MSKGAPTLTDGYFEDKREVGMSRTGLCPHTSDIIPGHYLNDTVGNSLPESAREVSVLGDKDNLSLLTVIDSKTKRSESWLFHNASKFHIDRALTTFADFDEKIIYIRSMGSQNYKAFLCSYEPGLPECPELAVVKEVRTFPEPKAVKGSASLGFPKAERVKPHMNIAGNLYLPPPAKVKKTVTSKEDETILIQVAQTSSNRFAIPRRPQKISPGDIASAKQSHKSKNREEVEWIPAGNQVNINGVTISCGMLYIGHSRAGEDSRDTTPAVIDLLAPVNLNYPDKNATGVKYWPSYSQISPEARAGYLRWLSGSRDNPEDAITWVFLFFYGLERRVIKDANSINDSLRLASRGELPSIKEEILRLRGVYGKHSSFNRYSEDLIHLIDIITDFPSDEPLEGSVRHKGQYSWEMRVKLGKLSKYLQPLPADLALHFARSHPNITLPKTAVRCSEEFDALFNLKYREKYGFGIVIPALKRRLVFRYVPATLGLDNDLSIELPLPDVAGSAKFEKALESLIDECSNALSRYSRFLASHPEEGNSIKGLSLLPSEILSEEQKAVLSAAVVATTKAKEKISESKKNKVEMPPVTAIPMPVVLDHKIVAAKEAETKQVSILLHDILSDDTEAITKIAAESPRIEASQDSTSQPWLEFNLDESHWKLLLVLATNPLWTREDLFIETKHLDLLPNGALDRLNESAIEYCEEPLTDEEEEGIIAINQQVLKDFLK